MEKEKAVKVTGKGLDLEIKIIGFYFFLYLTNFKNGVLSSARIPGINQMSRFAGVGKVSVARGIKVLEKKGWINALRDETGGFRLLNHKIDEQARGLEKLPDKVLKRELKVVDIGFVDYLRRVCSEPYGADSKIGNSKPISQEDIYKNTGLMPASSRIVVNRLVKAGVIMVSDIKRGRKKTLYVLRKEYTGL